MTDPDAAPAVPPHRARRMLAALVDGADPETIAAEETLPPEAVEQALGDALARRWAPGPSDYARLQIARLDAFCRALTGRAAAGDLDALDRALKVLDRLDRYHGFRRAAPAPAHFEESHRARLMAKINAIAANLAGDDESGRDGEA